MLKYRPRSRVAISAPAEGAFSTADERWIRSRFEHILNQYRVQISYAHFMLGGSSGKPFQTF